MTRLYKNIIFDFDGVIINSHDIQVKALTESFKAICGEGTPPYDDFFKLSGEGLKNHLHPARLTIRNDPYLPKDKQRKYRLDKNSRRYD